MTYFLVVYGGIAVIAILIGVWDWLAERQNRIQRHRGHSA